MKLIFFSKPFHRLDADQMIEVAHRFGFEGYDLCCREEYSLNPENVQAELPGIVSKMKTAGLEVPMMTGPTDLCDAGDPVAERLFSAMRASGIKLFKAGYVFIDNAKEDYWEKVSAVRHQLEQWSALGEKYGVRVCYHTHSAPRFMGINAAAVMHLVKDLDPQSIGVYLDPGHLLLDGEHPDIAFNMVRKYLAIMGLKDTAKTPDSIGPGWTRNFCRAGFGNVNWANVFDNLVRLNFDGPLSVHAEYEHHYPLDQNGERPAYIESLREEFVFFKKMRSEAISRQSGMRP